jgi:hypothetical protein
MLTVLGSAALVLGLLVVVEVLMSEGPALPVEPGSGARTAS